MRREQATRTLLFFLPTLVFFIVFTAPGGDYVFRASPLMEVAAGRLPYYVYVLDKTFHLYSSPYASWPYPKAVEVRLFYPTEVFISSTCGAVAASSVGGAPGSYHVDVVVPPGFQGDCWVYFTHPSGWSDAVLLRVKLVDWYPGATERAVVALSGSGWQFVQVGQDGVLYIWERPVTRVPVAGCVFVYNGSVLFAEAQRYREVAPGIIPPVAVPSSSGSLRYGAFIKLDGASRLYIYGADCPAAPRLNVSEPPPLRAEIGVVLPTPTGPVFDALVVEDSVMYTTGLRVINYTEASARIYRLYVYTYNTPVGLWGAVFRYNFALTTLLTVKISLLRLGGELQSAGDVWIYRVGNATYWIRGPQPYRLCEPPCAVPAGWQEPLYVVVDPTGQWGGWPEVAAVRRESLQPWKS